MSNSEGAAITFTIQQEVNRVLALTGSGGFTNPLIHLPRHHYRFGESRPDLRPDLGAVPSPLRASSRRA